MNLETAKAVREEIIHCDWPEMVEAVDWLIATVERQRLHPFTLLLTGEIGKYEGISKYEHPKESPMKALRCTRCGGTSFGLAAPEDIFEEVDSRLSITCRSCLARSEGTLIVVEFLEFLQEDINE